MLLLGGPRLPFNSDEIQDMMRYINEGGRVMLIMHEGGEQKLGTNINALLEQLGISVNSDTVIRKNYFKYLHPKEAYIANGILNNEIVR
jgi:intraflagellar transport protein 52